jgi:arginase family enzyme
LRFVENKPPMSDSNQTFDLTTKEGRKNALLVAQILFPPVVLGKALFDGIASLTSGTNEKEIEEQRKAAIDIIRAGKENGADEIEITMSQKAGVGLSSDVDGIPIEFIVGASGTMKLKVKYK